MSIDEGAGTTVDGFPIVVEGPSPPRTPVALPVEDRERVASVDVIRGVAVLGILAMNIVAFGWPVDVYEVPILAPDWDRADMALWALNYLLFHTKMMTLFSMLFGAGLVLMSDRAEGRGARLRGVYYRRSAWLLAIGLVHSYLIWDGDILVPYALCGFLLYPARKWPARRLIVVGACLNLLLVPMIFGFRFVGVPYLKEHAARAEAEIKAGRRPGSLDDAIREVWKEITKPARPTREEMLREIATYRGGYGGIVRDRAEDLVWGQPVGFLFVEWWFIGGRMLIGMGLMKLGVFSARLSGRAYLTMMAVGYGVGLPLMAFDAWHEASNGFFLDDRLRYSLDGWPMLLAYGSLPVVFGHIGLVMLICRSGALPRLTRRLAAAGRMALSCYLFDSIACTTFFYGYGLDYTASLHRPLLYAIVIAIWTAQLLVCPLWLEWSRFGPAEWAWRSLTYWKLQPIRARAG